MKSTALYLLLCFALIGCKHVSQEIEPLSYPTDFSSYVENFEELFELNVEANVHFGSLKEGAPARCLYELKQIQINEELWAVYSEPAREALIIHELGHCELGLHHTNDGESHIMSSFIGHNAKAYTENLEEEILYMLSEEHPRFK